MPVVHHPFDGKVHEAESCICVEENNELVVLDQIGQCRWLDPGRVSVFKFVCVHKFVVVAMDLGVCVVGEDTTRNVVDVAPVVFALLEHLSRLERPCVEIQNQNFIAHLLRVARVLRKNDLGAIGFADEWLRRRCLEWLVQNAQDIVDVWRFRVADGPVSFGQ